MNKLSLPHERGLVVFNPLKSSSRRFKTAEQQLAYAEQKYKLPLTRLRTEADRERTSDKIQQALRAGDLLMVLGGDGTVNVVAEALVANPQEATRLLAVPQGTANDFARSHSGKMTGVKAITRLLERDHQAVVRPLAVHVVDDSAKRTFLAVNNAGFHYTADFARRLDHPEHRASRLQRVPIIGQFSQEMRSVAQSLNNLTTFTCYDADEYDPRELLDRTLIHAKTVAKYGRFAVNHSSEYFLDISNAEPTRASVIKSAAQMALGRANGVERTSLTFTTGEESILGHVDGEVFAIAPYSTITAELFENSFTAYSRDAA
jgi:hypothetical protein